MKKLLIAGLILLVGLVVVTIALPLFISSEAVRTSLLQRAKEITGREMVFRGDPNVAFSPFLGIEIQDVEFRSGSGSEKPILTMPTLRAKLGIASALRGKVAIEEFQFVRPVFDITIARDGRTSWAFRDGDVWQVLGEARQVRDETETGSKPDMSKVPNIRLGLFTVFDGILNYNDERSGRKEVVSNLNGTLSWPSTRMPWKLGGNGIWRGDTVEAELDAQTPIMLLAGGKSDIVASINSEPLVLNFKGEANRFADLYFAGDLNANSPSLRRTINFLGGDAGSGSSFSGFSAKGKISGTLKDIQIQEARLELDGNAYSGSLRVSKTEDSKNRLSGTLATDSINASPYLSQLGSTEGIKSLFDILDGSEMDVRLSSKNLSLETISVTNFAGSLITRDEQFKIDIGNANIGDGIVVGKMIASNKSDGVSVGADITASSINPSSLPIFQKLSGLQPNGIGSIDLSLKSDAQHAGSFLNNLNGTFSLKMQSGVLKGLDFSQLRPSIDGKQTSPENIQIGDTLEQTPVKDFVLNVGINHGIAWVGDSSFNVEEFKARLSGKADLRSGNLALWGLMQKPDDEGVMRSLSQFFLGGTLAEPLYIPQFTTKSPIAPETADPERAGDPEGERGTN